MSSGTRILNKSAVTANVHERKLGPVRRGMKLSWACIDFKTAEHDDPVLGGVVHVIRHAGSVTGGATDVTVASNMRGKRGIARGEKTQSIANRLARHLGAAASAHHNCTDMRLTPHTVARMAMYDRHVQRLARAIVAPWIGLDAKDYLRVLAGSSQTLENDHVDDPAVVPNELDFGVARLRHAEGGDALFINGTNRLFLPTRFTKTGLLADMALYMAEPGHTVPDLASATVGAEIDADQRDIYAATGVHLAVLATSLELPVAVMHPDSSIHFYEH